jgi:hypothetical protein
MRFDSDDTAGCRDGHAVDRVPLLTRASSGLPRARRHTDTGSGQRSTRSFDAGRASAGR